MDNRESELNVYDQEFNGEQRDSSNPVLDCNVVNEERNDTNETIDENSETFNSFQYWKNPLPSINIDSELKELTEDNTIVGYSASEIPEVRVTDVEKADEILYLPKEVSETMSDFEEEISLNSSETLAENSIQDHEKILSQVRTALLLWPILLWYLSITRYWKEFPRWIFRPIVGIKNKSPFYLQK